MFMQTKLHPFSDVWLCCRQLSELTQFAADDAQRHLHLCLCKDAIHRGGQRHCRLWEEEAYLYSCPGTCCVHGTCYIYVGCDTLWIEILENCAALRLPASRASEFPGPDSAQPTHRGQAGSVLCGLEGWFGGRFLWGWGGFEACRSGLGVSLPLFFVWGQLGVW